MEYVSYLGLDKDPFNGRNDSSSFYPAASQMACLQKLELSVRLRQGLSILTGQVGSGKTAVCAQLMQRLQNPPGEIHCSLFPVPSGFTKPNELLRRLCTALDIEIGSEDKNELFLKEKIRKFLFHMGVEKNKTIVILIDDGHRLPSFAFEILRELLNYETNHHKLLQIVIFARDTFRTALTGRKNFSDRVASLCELPPLTFKETKELIRFSLRAVNCKTSDSLFSQTSIAAIRWLTRGTPLMILALCSQALTTLLVQNRAKVSSSVIIACARRQPQFVSRSPASFLQLLGVGAILTTITAFFLVQGSLPLIEKLVLQIMPGPPQHEQPAIVKNSEAPKATPLSAPEAPPTVPEKTLPLENNKKKSQVVQTALPPSQPTMETILAVAPAAGEFHAPEVLGELTLEQGDMLSKMIARVYGRFSEAKLNTVLKANKNVGDTNSIQVGTKLRFPLPTEPFRPTQDADTRYIQVASFSDFMAAYRFIRQNFPIGGPCPLTLVPALAPPDTLAFHVLVDKKFPSQKAALDAMDQLPSHLKKESCCVATPGDGLLLSQLPRTQHKDVAHSTD